MKKLFAVLLSVLLLCGIVTPAFAEDTEPDKPEPVATEIVSIPEKNKVVYTGGEPDSPAGYARFDQILMELQTIRSQIGVLVRDFFTQLLRLLDDPTQEGWDEFKTFLVNQSFVRFLIREELITVFSLLFFGERPFFSFWT